MITINEVTFGRKDDTLMNKTFEDIHYSRFIASWHNVTNKGVLSMELWLNQLMVNGKKLPEQVIRDICEMSMMGKMELEKDAERFVKEDLSKAMKELLEDNFII